MSKLLFHLKNYCSDYINNIFIMDKNKTKL